MLCKAVIIPSILVRLHLADPVLLDCLSCISSFVLYANLIRSTVSKLKYRVICGSVCLSPAGYHMLVVLLWVIAAEGIFSRLTGYWRFEFFVIDPSMSQLRTLADHAGLQLGPHGEREAIRVCGAPPPLGSRGKTSGQRDFVRVKLTKFYDFIHKFLNKIVT
jgi:hypothetical protein